MAYRRPPPNLNVILFFTKDQVLQAISGEEPDKWRRGDNETVHRAMLPRASSSQPELLHLYPGCSLHPSLFIDNRRVLASTRVPGQNDVR